MSWIETWLDTAIAPPLAAILAALDQSGAKAVNFYVGGRYSAGRGWTPQLSAELARERPDIGQFGTWVSLSPGQGGYALGHQDGLDAVAAARAYPVIAWLAYDIEPSTWQAWPAGVDDAMRGFADAAHGAGCHVLDYGTPAADAGASNENAIWIANPNPGGGDPALQPLDPVYYAGRRAVQFGTAVYAGVTWDLTRSEFSIGGQMTLDPSDPTDKALIDDVAAIKGLLVWAPDVDDGQGGKVHPTIAVIKDVYNLVAYKVEPEELAAVKAAVDGLSGTQVAIKTELDQVAAAQAGGTPADLSALMAAVAAADGHVGVLGKHLGVDVASQPAG